MDALQGRVQAVAVHCKHSIQDCFFQLLCLTMVTCFFE